MRGLVAATVAVLAASTALSPAAHADEQVCRFSDERFTEVSGMTYSLRDPDVVWLHNDSGDGPYIYAVNARTCKTLARITIDGVDARDVEAITIGRDRARTPWITVADIGDNLDSWSEVHIYRFREPAQLVDQMVEPKVYRVTYRDRPHNAETLLSDPQSMQLWIVTKQLAHGRLYRLPKHLSESTLNIAKPVGREGGTITDGSVSPDGSRYVLRDYVEATLYTGLPPGSKTAKLELPFQPQGEAITWTADGSSLLVASERDNRLLRVEVPPAEQQPAAEATSQTPAADPAATSPSAVSTAAGNTGYTESWWWTAAVGLVVLAALVAVVAVLSARRRSRGRHSA